MPHHIETHLQWFEVCSRLLHQMGVFFYSPSWTIFPFLLKSGMAHVLFGQARDGREYFKSFQPNKTEDSQLTTPKRMANHEHWQPL